MINFKNSDFCKLLRLCAISALQISKKHFATFDFFAKRKLVLTVWVSTSLSKFGYYKPYLLSKVTFKDVWQSDISFHLELRDVSKVTKIILDFSFHCKEYIIVLVYNTSKVSDFDKRWTLKGRKTFKGHFARFFW